MRADKGRRSMVTYEQTKGIRRWIYMALDAGFWTNDSKVSSTNISTLRRNTDLYFTDTQATHKEMLKWVIGQYYGMTYSFCNKNSEKLKWEIYKTVSENS